METIRLKFNKVGLASYFSQLDLQRAVARAFKKSGLPVWYSQGFNPHIYMTFTLPLSLGHESYCESVDFRLNEKMEFSDVVAALQNTMPTGIEVVEACEVDYQPQDIKYAEYIITMYSDKNDIHNALESYINAQEVNIEKKSKKKTKIINLKELVNKIETLEIDENKTKFSIIFPAGVSLNINPNLFLDYISTISKVKTFECDVIRLKLLDENMNILQQNTCI